jgi:hypothetical protein
MSSRQELNGKYFEYAIATTAKKILNSINIETSIKDDNVSRNAFVKFNSFNDVGKKLSIDMILSKVMGHILCNENDLVFKSKQATITFNPDTAGADGDPRDIVIHFYPTKLIIGISAKHNSISIKSPRLSLRTDFFSNFGIKSSPIYGNDILKVLKIIENRIGDLWSNWREKEKDCYSAIVSAISSEICKNQNNQQFCQGILDYFVGRYDHYKVSFNKKDSSITVEEYKKSSIQKPTAIVKNQLVGINKILIGLDNGYEIGLRAHNGDSIIKQTGIKIEASLLKYPQSIYSKVFV